MAIQNELKDADEGSASAEVPSMSPPACRRTSICCGPHVGNELFRYIFDGEPTRGRGTINVDDELPGLDLNVNEDSLNTIPVPALI